LAQAILAQAILAQGISCFSKGLAASHSMSSMSPVPRPVCRPGLVRPSVRSDVVDALDGREESPAKLSRPQKRRKRMQTLAAFRAFKSASGTKQCEGDSSESAPSVHAKLDRLEGMVSQLLAVSGCHFTCMEFCDPSMQHHNETSGLPGAFEETLYHQSESDDTQIESMLSALRPDAAPFYPANFADQDCCSEGDAIQDKDAVGAAFGSSSDKDEREIPCAKCGQPLDESGVGREYNGDRCDTCDRYVHSRCLNDFQNFRGEWSLCDFCLDRFESTPGLPSIRCDVRALPSSYWEKLYTKFCSQQPLNDPAIGRGSPEARSHSKEEFGENDCNNINSKCDDNDVGMAAIFQPLDNVLDFVVKFLEGEHPKSSCMASDTRAMILAMVRQSLAWKTENRTADEVRAKVIEINHIMSTVAAGLS